LVLGCVAIGEVDEIVDFARSTRWDFTVGAFADLALNGGEFKFGDGAEEFVEKERLSDCEAD